MEGARGRASRESVLSNYTDWLCVAVCTQKLRKFAKLAKLGNSLFAQVCLALVTSTHLADWSALRLIGGPSCLPSDLISLIRAQASP